MAGFGPIASFPIAALPGGGAAPGKAIFYGSNATTNRAFPGANHLIFGGGMAVQVTAYPHVTWMGIEALHAGHASARESWVGIEVLRSVTTVSTKSVVTWIGLEVVHTGHSSSRASWIGTEVLHSGSSRDRVSWTGAEVLRSVTTGATQSRVSWIAVEVLRSVASRSPDSGWVSLLAA